ASARLYIEAYGADSPARVPVRLVDEAGATVWRTDVALEQANGTLRTAAIELPADTLPFGRLWVEVGAEGATRERTPLVVSISDQWMAANFDEVLEFLEYIAAPAELDSLRFAEPAERRARSESVWARRDPVPAAPINQYREQVLGRRP